MDDSAWYSKNDKSGFVKRVERVLTVVQAHTPGECAGCGKSICGHAVVLSIVAGYEDRPQCLNCLAEVNNRDVEMLRDQMALFVHSKPCLTQGWRLASIREGADPTVPPSCMWSAGEVATATASTAIKPPPRSTERKPDDHFDAGDQGCGDLALALRIRMNRMDAGSLLRLTATDPGAPEDIPAWCRLTQNKLIAMKHPDYFIERNSN